MTTYCWNNERLIGDDALDERIEQALQEVEDMMPRVHAITWDGCHKIYIMLDSVETEVMRLYGYPIVEASGIPPEVLIETLGDWYDRSCMLRFINTLSSVNDETVFGTVIPQIFVDDSEEEIA